ncbi:hypothetical protein ACFQ10_05605 [Streptomyces indonesiensis]
MIRQSRFTAKNASLMYRSACPTDSRAIRLSVVSQTFPSMRTGSPFSSSSRWARLCTQPVVPSGRRTRYSAS